MLRIDIETYSSVDLKKCGLHKYVESDDFEVMLFGYSFGDVPVAVIDLAQGESLTPRLVKALKDPSVIKTAFNAAFEIACLSKHLGEPLDPAQWRCTSVHALYLGLPGSLADVGKVVGASKQKLAGGWPLIRYFCVPCKPTQVNHGRTRNLPRHDPEKWRLFKEYCAVDVESERDIANKLARFQVPDKEHKLWVLDQKMNNRGIKIDRELVMAAIECDEQHKAKLIAEAVQLTGLDNPNSRDQLLEWLQQEEDASITDLKKKSLPKILAGTDSATVRRVLELRQELSKTSISKYHAMARSVCNDDRVRGLTRFYGANRTGRWAGQLVQVQNLATNKLRDIDLARNLLKQRRFDEIEMLFGSVADTLSQLVRTAFVAPKLVVVDFSAIEARVIAWLAGCQWRLDVFNSHGKIYEASAETMFKLPPGSVTRKSPYRQKGKIAELALGYQGGANALKTMGALEMGLTEDELEPIKVAWRQANPEIVDLWYAVERAAIQAVREKTTLKLRQLVFSYESGFLFITLPGGRRLAYVKPRIVERDYKPGEYVIARAGSLTYEGTDQKTRQWCRLGTYGGKLVENIVQGIARDCLAEVMLDLDASDLDLEQLMTVHDEIVSEGSAALADVEAVMGRPIAWAPGLPLRGDGFETPYYMKESD